MFCTGLDITCPLSSATPHSTVPAIFMLQQSITFCLSENKPCQAELYKRVFTSVVLRLIPLRLGKNVQSLHLCK